MTLPQAPLGTRFICHFITVHCCFIRCGRALSEKV